MGNITAENIRRFREQRSWTQAHLAEAAALSERTVQRAEEGKPIGAESLQAIAGALDVSLDDLRRPPGQAEMEKIKSRYSVVRLQRIERGADVGRVFGGAHAMNFDCPGVDSEAGEDAAAELEQELKDLMDLWSDLEPLQRRGGHEGNSTTSRRPCGLGARGDRGKHSSPVPTPRWR